MEILKTAASFLSNHEDAKRLGDAIAVSISIGTIVNFLPAFAALFTILWTGLRIVEMFYGPGSIQKWWASRKKK